MVLDGFVSRCKLVLPLLVAASIVLVSQGASATPGSTIRVSVDSAGSQGNADSGGPVLSAEGRYVAFHSNASNLVTGDTNHKQDVFVRDQQTGTTTRVSVDSAGNQANGDSWYPSISADGRYVAFYSSASNLVPGDANAASDVFVYDRQTGATSRVSVSSDGTEANGVTPAISGDGRYVAFFSSADNLVPGDTNGCSDAFIHDRQTGQTTRVSVDSAGNQGNGTSYWSLAISGDGRYVAFDSLASNLVPNDTNEAQDMFLHDRQTGQTIRVSVDSAGNESEWGADNRWPSVTADGRYVAFYSEASNLVPGDTNGQRDIFVHDRQTQETTRVSVDSAGNQANGGSWMSAISADGRHVAFESGASNLVPGGTGGSDILVHDRQTGQTTRVSVDSAGNQANGQSWHPSISADGRYVAFYSSASNLVPGDSNAVSDVFVHDRGTRSTTREAGPGETVVTDTANDGATLWDPVEVSLTTPNLGTVSIEESSISATPPNGFQFLGQQVGITAPSTTAQNPLTIIFRMDSSLIPAGGSENTVQLFKNGVQVASCEGAPGIASPDPCVSHRGRLPDSDVEITALTSSASVWNLGVPTQPSAPVGGVAEAPPSDTEAPTSEHGSSEPDALALAGLAVGGALLLAAGAWYVRRRWRTG